jgi:nitroreductase
MELKRAIEKRKTVKIFFEDKKPDWRKVVRAIDLARFAPSAGNQSVLKFILVDDKEIIKELAKASQQKFVEKAAYVVIFLSDPAILKRSYGDKGERFAAQQAGAAIENFLLGLVKEGLSSCWVGHFYEEQVRRASSIPDKLKIEGLFPIGFEAKNSHAEQRKKTDLENMLYFNTHGNKHFQARTIVRQNY